MAKPDSPPPTNFIRNIVEDDLKTGKWDGRVVTRFPPEPNGYLHIGHAKSMLLNFGIARDYGGECHLRFDDTNPEKESTEFIQAIKEDVRWLGLDWGDTEYYASNYFQQLHDFAVRLIEKGSAFVCDLSAEQMRQHRGNLTEAGQDSPFRGRGVEENLELFARMRAGEFEEGSKTLRAKIDMSHPNLVMRDPVLYRIRKVEHHRTGDAWPIYPMYDFTHCLSDSMEGVTHSICTLEFEDNRALYDWMLNELEVYHPQQIEFARLNLEFTMMSKRLLMQLVDEGLVDGWDDPRMPTLVGMRRRGYPPEAIKTFCEMIGVAKRASMVDIGKLEWAIRNHLNTTAPRVMGVLDPLKVVIENYPEDMEEEFECPYLPDDPPAMGSRKVPFSRELWVEREDFMEEPHKKFWRLALGREVRLRWAYFITCNEIIKDNSGQVTELRCSYDPATKGGDSPDGRKVRGTIHWTSVKHAIKARVRLYDRLFKSPKPGQGEDDWRDDLNPDSLMVTDNARLEPSLADAQPGQRFQFERKGYFCVDSKDSAPGAPVFNRTVTMRDAWAKIVKALQNQPKRKKHKKKRQQKQPRQD